MAQLKPFNLGEVFETTKKGLGFLDYAENKRLSKENRQIALEDRQRKIQGQNQTRMSNAQKDMDLIMSNIDTESETFGDDFKKAMGWAGQRNPQISKKAYLMSQRSPEEQKMFVENLRGERGVKAKTEQQTIYGPDGATKRVALKKGTDYTPPEGWSLAKPATPKSGKGNRPNIAKLMAAGWMPGSRITGPMLDAFEAAAEVAEEEGVPLTVEKLKKMEFNAVKNRRTGSTAGGRLTIARAQNIEAGQELIGEMKETAKKLDFSNIKLKGKFELWKKGQLNDPILAEYMTQRADALFIITSAMKMNGVTDKSIEIEEEAFPVESSPRAFNAWFRTQMRGLNRTARKMNRDFGYGIKIHTIDEEGEGKGEKSKYEEGQTANGGKLIFSGGVWKDNI